VDSGPVTPGRASRAPRRVAGAARARRGRPSPTALLGAARAGRCERTEERLLDAALVSVARHGLSKLTMADVSAVAGVSRGTAYRYFPNVEALLCRLGQREASRFEQRVWEAMEQTPPGPQRLQVVLEYAAGLARDHPLVHRLPETDPGLVLVALRERFPSLLAAFERLLAPLLAETSWVRAGAVSQRTLANWTARVLVSNFLFPDPEPEAMAASLANVHRMLAGR
jgi:AcrR family transcriptional regulator